MSDLRPAFILLDLDGTLIDTAPDLVRALNQTLSLEGLPPASLNDARRFVGRGARVLIERAAASSGAELSDAKLTELTQAFLEFYRVDIASQSTPYPGCLGALTQLRHAGASLAVCTNKHTELSILLLNALDMTHFFDAIVGADAVANRKPHGDHVRHTIRQLNGSPDRTVMIGDSSADVLSAKEAGVHSILVDFGYNDAAPIDLGADFVVSHFDEVPALIARILQQ